MTIDQATIDSIVGAPHQGKSLDDLPPNVRAHVERKVAEQSASDED